MMSRDGEHEFVDADDTLKRLAKQVLPASALARLRRARRRRLLDRLEPVSRCFGMDRGRPVDRAYIEAFLAEYAADVRGHVMEIGDDTYTRAYGGERVTQSDVLHAVAGNDAATLVGDLASGAGVPRDQFDCMICTQTLMFIYDLSAAVRTLHDSLRPGGVALATVAGISHIARYDMDQWGDYWRFTSMAVARLFGEAFGGANVEVRTYGNALAASAMLHGLTVEELEPHELQHHDRDYEVIIGVRAARKGSA